MRFSKLATAAVVAALLGVGLAYAQTAPTVKNYFARCAGTLPCDNILNIGGTAQYRNRGTVTQITSISTGVTLNATSGTITTVSQTIAAGAEGVFQVTNSAVGANDVIILSMSNAGAGTFIAAVSQVAAGSFTITITNLDAAAAGNSALTINFAVIKSLA